MRRAGRGNTPVNRRNSTAGRSGRWAREQEQVTELARAFGHLCVCARARAKQACSDVLMHSVMCAGVQPQGLAWCSVRRLPTPSRRPRCQASLQNFHHPRLSPSPWMARVPAVGTRAIQGEAPSESVVRAHRGGAFARLSRARDGPQAWSVLTAPLP